MLIAIGAVLNNGTPNAPESQPSRVVGKAAPQWPWEFIPFSSKSFTNSIRLNITVTQLNQFPRDSLSFRQSTVDATFVQ